MEMEDRFKFKVWDYRHERFCEEWESKDGRLSGFVRLDIDEETGIEDKINCSLSFFSDKHRFHIIQCAGVKDKVGNLIYGGFILISSIGEQKQYHRVVFKNGSFGVASAGHISFIHLDSFVLHEGKVELEIAGNQFQNMELLKIECKDD